MRREDLLEEIAGLIRDLIQVSRESFRGCADELQLGPGEAQALWLLGITEATSTGDLARRLRVDPANASTLLTKLEKRRLVTREPAKHDRRKRRILLTPAGRKARQELVSCMANDPPSFAELSTTELRSLRDLLRRVDRT